MDININDTKLNVNISTKPKKLDVNLGVPKIVTHEKNHANLENLDYENSGHTGFQKAGDYALRSEIPNVDNFATKEEIPTKTSELINDSDFITEIPSEYITETELNEKGYLTSVPKNYKTKEENDVLYQEKGDYLTDYTETDPTVPNYVKNIKETDIANWNNKSEFSGSYNDLIDKPTIPTVPTNISAFNNDVGYLTEHQDLSDYAKKTDIPDVSNFITKDVSNLTNYYNKDYIDEMLGDIEALLGGI